MPLPGGTMGTKGTVVEVRVEDEVSITDSICVWSPGYQAVRVVWFDDLSTDMKESVMTGGTSLRGPPAKSNSNAKAQGHVPMRLLAFGA